jgi:hypothetical protein
MSPATTRERRKVRWRMRTTKTLRYTGSPPRRKPRLVASACCACACVCVSLSLAFSRSLVVLGAADQAEPSQMPCREPHRRAKPAERRPRPRRAQRTRGASLQKPPTKVRFALGLKGKLSSLSAFPEPPFPLYWRRTRWQCYPTTRKRHQQRPRTRVPTSPWCRRKQAMETSLWKNRS